MWVYLSFLFAIVTSINSIVYKSLTKKIHHLSIALASLVFALPFLFVIILYFYQIPRVDYLFWIGVTGSATLNIAATTLFFTALKLSDISLLAPISAFNPVFTTIVSFFTLGEAPTAKGLLGILLISLGGYFLNFSQIKKGIFAPIKKLLLDRGVQLMFICYFIWAITPTFEKTAIRHTIPETPPFASLLASSILSLALIPVVFRKVKKPVKEIMRHFKIFLFTGLLGAIAQAAAFNAFSLALLGYVTAIFKISMFFTIILAWIFLKEKGIKDRFLGSVIMFAGVLLLVV